MKFELNIGNIIPLVLSAGSWIWIIAMKFNDLKHVEKDMTEIKNDINKMGTKIDKNRDELKEKFEVVEHELSNRLTAIETGCKLRHKNGRKSN